jgi:hypothetical protein
MIFIKNTITSLKNFKNINDYNKKYAAIDIGSNAMRLFQATLSKKRKRNPVQQKFFL